jgi:glycosyltransferase involved in cell wall biosynthesis
VKAIAGATWQRGMLNHAARLHVTSEEEGRQIADVATRVPRAVIPNGIRCAEYATLPPREAFRAKHLRGFDGPLVLPRAVSQKKARRARACLRACGGPSPRRACDRRAGRRGLASPPAGRGRDVTVGLLTGEDKLKALAAADVWALPSHGENFGNAVVEAMAAGRAVVVSPQVNIAGDAALAGAAIVAERDPAAFASALRLLAIRAPPRDGRARLAFARRYDWSAVAPRMVEMYEDIARRMSGSAIRFARCTPAGRRHR